MSGFQENQKLQFAQSANLHIGTKEEKMIHREINKYFKFYVRKSGWHLASPLTLFYHDMVINSEVRNAAIELKAALKNHRLKGVIDHINRNPKDNAIKNLRQCTVSQNICNQPKRKNTTSKFRGVSFIEKICRKNKSTKNKTLIYFPKKKWQSSISINHKTYSKSFLTEIEAAKWWDKMAMKHRREFAYLNFKDES